MNSFTAFFKSAAGIVTIVAVIVVVGGGALILKPKTSSISTFTVASSTFTQVVSVTGSVVPVQTVSLGFQASGEIAAVNKDVGDYVNQGDVIAYLDSSVLQANLVKAQSDLQGAQAQLAEVSGSIGTSSPSQTASLDVVNAEKAAVDTVQQAYTSADDAVHNQVDQFFTDPRKADPKILFAFTDYDLYTKINTERASLEFLLNSWQASSSAVNLSNFTISDLQSSNQNLLVVQNFLNDVASAVNEFQATPQIPQSTIDQYRAAVSTARTEVNNSITAVTAAEDSLTSSQSGNGVQQAAVSSAAAVVAQIQAQIDQTVMTAPFDGQVTLQNAKVGQVATAGVPLVSLISASKYEIDAYVAEADIAKVQLNDMASVTLDAYGNDVVFQAKVVEIDPAETVEDGVSTYKVELDFTTNDDRVKSGMTANVDIITEQKSGEIVVPQRVVLTETNGKYVTVLDPNDSTKTEQREVTTGNIDENGNIEILSGLNIGDQVLTDPTQAAN